MRKKTFIGRIDPITREQFEDKDEQLVARCVNCDNYQWIEIWEEIEKCGFCGYQGDFLTAKDVGFVDITVEEEQADLLNEFRKTIEKSQPDLNQLLEYYGNRQLRSYSKYSFAERIRHEQIISEHLSQQVRQLMKQKKLRELKQLYDSAINNDFLIAQDDRDRIHDVLSYAKDVTLIREAIGSNNDHRILEVVSDARVPQLILSTEEKARIVQARISVNILSQIHEALDYDSIHSLQALNIMCESLSIKDRFPDEIQEIFINTNRNLSDLFELRRLIHSSNRPIEDLSHIVRHKISRLLTAQEKNFVQSMQEAFLAGERLKVTLQTKNSTHEDIYAAYSEAIDSGWIPERDINWERISLARTSVSVQS